MVNIASWVASHAPGAVAAVQKIGPAAAAAAEKGASAVTGSGGGKFWKWLGALGWIYTAGQIADPLLDTYVTGKSAAERELQRFSAEQQRQGMKEAIGFYQKEAAKDRRERIAIGMRDTEMAALAAEGAAGNDYGQRAMQGEMQPKLSASLATRGDTPSQMEYARKLASGGELNPLLVLGMNFG